MLILILIEILSNALDICMYFPEEEVKEARRTGRHGRNRGKKQTFIHSKKIERKEKREEKFVVPHNTYLPVVPPRTS